MSTEMRERPDSARPGAAAQPAGWPAFIAR
jgi:hypothetical protein